MSAKLFRVSLGVGIGQLHTAIVARNAVVLENAGTRLEACTQNLVYHQGCIC